MFRGLSRDATAGSGGGEGGGGADAFEDEEEDESAGAAAGSDIYQSKLSATSSQESLHSDNNGGCLTHLRYYHVFREGELDYLINNYVDSLHIISSYYDHANWCVVAEKVNVWTL